MALAIAGCTLDFGTAAGPATLDRAEAQAYLAALQVAQRDALDLWARLIAGEAISCEQAITLPPPLTEHAGTTRAQERSEEHTSELQSRENRVCSLLL